VSPSKTTCGPLPKKTRRSPSIFTGGPGRNPQHGSGQGPHPGGDAEPDHRKNRVYLLHRQPWVILIHPESALINVDLSEYGFIADQKVRKVGYLEYNWKNPGETHPRPKALYMTYFEPWDWIISVSSYRNEFIELVNVDDFRDSILSLVFGQTGYSYVVDTQGNLIVHPSLKGNYFEATDEKGRQFIQEICDGKAEKSSIPGNRTNRKRFVRSWSFSTTFPNMSGLWPLPVTWRSSMHR
jgi:hypothetical protein